MRDKTSIALSWSFIDGVGVQVLHIILISIIARLLSPEEFGLLAMVTVLTGFADSFVDMGFSAALVQKKDVTDEAYSSVFWVNILIGTILVVFFLLMAKPISIFYDESKLSSIVYAISFNFIFVASYLVHRAKLQKELNFKLIAIANISGLLVSGMLMLVCATYGLGVWSLVLKIISQSLVVAIVFWVLHKWRPRFTINWHIIKEYWQFSKNLLLVGIFGYWSKHLDSLLLGKYLGQESLGLYGRAKEYALKPIHSLHQKSLAVSYSEFSLKQDSHQDFNDSVIRLTSISVFVLAFPIAFLYVFAIDVVNIVLGGQWIGIVNSLKIFCIVSFIFITEIHTPVFNSIGKSKLTLNVNILRDIIRVFLVTIGVVLLGNIYDTAIMFLISAMINWIISYYFCWKLNRLNIPRLIYQIVLSSLPFVIFIVSIEVSRMFFTHNIIKEIILGAMVVLFSSAIIKPLPVLMIRKKLLNR